MYLCVLLRAAESHFFFRCLELNFTAKILNYILIAFTWKKPVYLGFCLQVILQKQSVCQMFLNIMAMSRF